MDSDHYLFLLSNIHFLPFTTSSLVILSIAVIFLFFSAVLSGAESALYSLSSIDKEKIENIKYKHSYHLESLLSDTDKLQISLSIWNNFSNICIIILSLHLFYNHLVVSNIYWAYGVISLVLIFVILLFGQIIPRIYAQNHSLRYIEQISPILQFLNKITNPLSSLFIRFSLFTQNIFKKKENEVSVDELSKALELTSEELDEEKEMLEGIINLYSKTAAEIMTPRMDMASLDISTSFKDVISYIVEVEYSRIPVYGNNPDDIKGILYIKDLLPYLDKENDFEWQKLIRSPFFVSESKKIDDLLEEFRSNKNHIAIVVDEYGGTSGIVTMEDILEEIVGEINDEYDDDEEIKFIRSKDGSFIFNGKILLSDFFKITDIDPKTFGNLVDDIDTLAGLILEIKGDFPIPKESIIFNNYIFQVLEMDNKRILKIKMQNNKDES